MRRLRIIFSILYFLPAFSSGYNILGILPVVCRSHSVMYDPIMEELSRRGHNVTSYSAHLQESRPVSYRQVDIRSCFPKNPRYGSVENMRLTSQHDLLNWISDELPHYSNLLKCQPIVDLLNGNEKFDLLITEPFHSDLFSAFAHELKIPTSVHIFSTTLYTWLLNRMGSPSNPSYIPEKSSSYVKGMNFMERVNNLWLYINSEMFFKNYLSPRSEEIYTNLFGVKNPTLEEIAGNVSLILVNTHFSLQPAMPLVPGIVEVSGVHLKQASPLPKNIEKFIDESEHGVVYFSMGSLLRSETFPEAKRNAFLTAFSKIPQRILWKWEGKPLPEKSDKIMMLEWMPQRDILAHPKVRLFISHGGLLGTTEAVYEGVPILGIPIFGDQRTNVKIMESNGAGELLEYNDIAENVVFEKIQRLINNPKYKENAKQLSERYRDRPMSPLDTAIYWIEYVIRHKGASHLKTAAVELSWYQYLLLDVIAFVTVVIITLLLIIYCSFKLIVSAVISLIYGKRKPSTSTRKQKKN